MNFFRNLLQRSVPTRAQTEFDPANPFAGQGFVFTETRTSPDGAILVFNGYSGGEKGPTIIEPKIVSAATGRVLVDLWHTYQHYTLRFLDDTSAAELRAENTHNKSERIVLIDFTIESFVQKENPAARHALAKLPDFISLF